MNELFYDGFTSKSFLNISKQLTERLYKTYINAPTNSNKIYNSEIDFKYYFRNNCSINAGVNHTDNTDVVSMNIGTLGIIYSYFYNVLSRNDMLVNIGKAKIENNLSVRWGFDLSKKQILFNKQPLCEDRIAMANLLAVMAVRYVNCHELGHLVNGHIFYLKEKTGRFELLMNPNKEKFEKDIPPLDRRVLEMDADAFAATQGIINIIEILKDPKNFNLFLKILREPLELFKMWTFSIHSLFLLFELTSGSVPLNPNMKYLPFDIRQILNLGSALASFENHINQGYFQIGEKRRNDILTYYTEGIVEAENCFNKLMQRDFNYLKSSYSELTNYYVNEINKRWLEIEPELRKYARTRLYMPK